jgi:predicted Zn-dependent protease with MMP-like domain
MVHPKVFHVRLAYARSVLCLAASLGVRRSGEPARATIRPRSRAVKQKVRARDGCPNGRYVARVHVSRRRFEQLVAEALDDLPEPLLEGSENVVIVVEDAPTRDQIEATEDAEGIEELFGLYEGVALTDRGFDAPFLPDRITLFRLALINACQDEDQLYEEIRVTLVHEFAHHFGIDDDRLDELGWA